MNKLCFSFFLIVPSISWANIQVAIIDTGFCPEQIKVKTNISIEKVIDLTNSVDQGYCKKFNSNLPRFHGHLVLQNFINFLVPTTEKIIITPIIIFDNRGSQAEKYWQKAVRKKFDLVLSAAGLVSSRKKIPALNGIWFVAVPRVGPGIKKDTQIFPTSIAPQNNLFIIGDYIDGAKILFDEGQLYQEKIDYFFSTGTGDLTGTSRAVTEAASRAINFCGQKLKTGLRECLKNITFDVQGMKSF